MELEKSRGMAKFWKSIGNFRTRRKRKGRKIKSRNGTVTSKNC